MATGYLAQRGVAAMTTGSWRRSSESTVARAVVSSASKIITAPSRAAKYAAAA